MTKKICRTGGVIAATALVWAALAGHDAQAAGVFDPPRLARNYITWMARSFDQCNPATLSVVTPMLPSGGCLSGHAATSNNNSCDFARLTVSGTPARIRLFARGCKCGSRIGVQLTIRVTKPSIATKHNGSSDVTFEDQTIICGPLPGAVNGAGNDSPNGYYTALSPSCLSGRCSTGSCGNVASSISLADCLGNSLKNLDAGNIEIMDAALVDRDNGNEPFMTPGIFR
jgi:hypothetical protein